MAASSTGRIESLKDPNRFFLVAGHEDEEKAHQRILEAEEGYAVVEKLGTAGVEAARLDPRQDDGY